jgi:hypothetical protein
MRHTSEHPKPALHYVLLTTTSSSTAPLAPVSQDRWSRAGAALTVVLTPVELKEIVYQAVPYAGMAKVFDFLHAHHAPG